MKNNDVALIQRILSDDESAFAELVKKHHKAVHALAWRKVGDFHIAEDITQDTFLKVYQRLHTLKDPNLFSGWLYVITTRLCDTWLRKKRILTEPLEDVEPTMTQRDTYSQHVVKDRKNAAVESQREVVKKLLAKLKESERTVMTLHYLGEMKIEEISRFLGVSASTIKSRLRRARNRLQKEEPMIREALENYQITPNLTENIMREIARLKPAAPTGGKPLVPWAIAASSALLIILLLGLGSQHLLRFQQPYSLDAQAKTTVELVDAPIMLNLEVKADVKNQLGSSNPISINENNGQKPDEVLLAAADTEGEDTSAIKQQWIQRNGPETGISMSTLFHTSDGEIYFIHPSNTILKLPVDRSELQTVKDVSDLVTGWDDEILLTELNDRLYSVLSNELYSSTDGGKTWLSVGKCPEGKATKLVTMDEVFYLAHEEHIFRSTDIGQTWTALDKGLTGRINTLDANRNTLFVSTDTGFYRLSADNWQRLQFPVEGAEVFKSFAVTEKDLYVHVETEWRTGDPKDQTWWLFRSTDNGDSWTDITPTNAWQIIDNHPLLTIVAMGNTVLLIGIHDGFVARSIDNGNTWKLEEYTGIPASSYAVSDAVAINESTYFTIGNSGILHSDDGGISWQRIRVSEKSRIDNIIRLKTNNMGDPSASFYAMIINEVFQSNDKGKSWKVVNPKIQIKKPTTYPMAPPKFTRIGGFGGILYAKHGGESLSSEKTGLYRISADGGTFVPIQGMPTLDSRKIKNVWEQRMQGASNLSDEDLFKELKETGIGSTVFFKQLARGEPHKQNQQIKNQLYTEQIELFMFGLRGGFAVSGDTFYIEYNCKLFRWEPGDKEWHDTGVEETTPELVYRKAAEAFEQEGLAQDKIMEIITSWFGGFKLAVSGDTVYVGKRDGHLLASFDRGDDWIDLTPFLPFPVKAFKDIVFVGDTVCVATDVGVFASDQGNNWGAITDSDGTNLNMDILAVDGNRLYGVTKRTADYYGVTNFYRLEEGIWKRIATEVPDRVNSLVVDGNTLYVATEDRGMLHFTLEE